MTLADYNIPNGAMIHAHFRFEGGMLKRTIDSSLPRSDEVCMITFESTKEHVTVVLKMPCTHSVSQSSDGLRLVRGEQLQIKCPQCGKEWPFHIIKQYGGAPSTELGQLELGISQNFLAASSEINQCRKCKTYFTRENSSINNVKCVVCSMQQKSSYYFCWYCLQDWKNPLSSAACGNEGCGDTVKLEKLRTSGKIKVSYSGVETFKLRACPNCGTIIELASGCKQMHCKACSQDFCFVCLRMKSQGSWSCGSNSTVCVAAPPQTVIPRQK